MERVDIILKLHQFTRGIREMAATAAGLRGIGAAADATTLATERLGRRSFAYNQLLFTMRRAIFGVTAALTIMTAGVFVAGFKFDATIERATIALKYLSKNTFDANEEMRELLHIARDTAFLPEQIINAGQQLLAFGFTAEETNRTLRATGDAIAALHLPQETVDRIVLALGQIRVKGRVTGEELRQLANANINAYGYLEKAFGKNVVQIGRIADAGIEAGAGIRAILTGLEGQYGGASKAIRETTTSQWEILKGDTQAIFGGIVRGAFERMGAGIRNVTDITGLMFDAVVDNNAGFTDLVVILDEATGGQYHFGTALRRVADVMSNVWNITKAIFDVLKPFLAITLLIVGALSFLTDAFSWFVDIGQPVIWFLRLMVLWITLDIIVTKIYTLWTKRAALSTKLLAFWTRAATAARVIGTGVLALYAAATWVATAAMTALAAAEWAALAPWLLLIGAVVLIIGTLVVLELKFGVVSKSIRWLGDKVQWLWNKLRDFGSWLKDHNPLGFLSDAAGTITGIGGRIGLATGGTVGSAGSYMVGERGPEMVSLPAGARVSPMAVRPMDWSAASAGGGGANINIFPAPIYLDGREIAEVVFKHRADKIARR